MKEVSHIVTTDNLLFQFPTATPMITATLPSSLSPADIVFGSNFTLTCISSGSPPDTFTWMKNGVQLTQSSNITALNHTITDAIFSSSYTISNIGVGDNGTYMCTVTNPIGNDSHTIIINIRKLLLYVTGSVITKAQTNSD